MDPPSDVKLPFFQSWTHHKMIEFKFKHTWTIDHFSLILANPKYSGWMAVPGHPDLQFNLSVNVSTDDQSDEQLLWLNLFCKLNETIKSNVSVIYSISFVKTDGGEEKAIESKYAYLNI